MNSYLKLALAGFAVVAFAVGGLYLVNRGPTGAGAGGEPAPTPSPTPWPTASGITGWTTYTSDVYGLTFGYPDNWELFEAATDRWRPGSAPEGLSYWDWFSNPETRDGDEIVFAVAQLPTGSGADITTREGLVAWVQATYCDARIASCGTEPDLAALPMCVGKSACLPAILVPLPEDVMAAFADSENGMVNVVSLLRHDSFPATARYGGGVQLLKSILTTMDVWTPEPGQVPSP